MDGAGGCHRCKTLSIGALIRETRISRDPNSQQKPEEIKDT